MTKESNNQSHNSEEKQNVVEIEQNTTNIEKTKSLESEAIDLFRN